MGKDKQPKKVVPQTVYVANKTEVNKDRRIKKQKARMQADELKKKYGLSVPRGSARAFRRRKCLAGKAENVSFPEARREFCSKEQEAASSK